MPLSPAALRELTQALGPDRVRTGDAALIAYGYDATFQHGRPDAVVEALSTQDVVAVVRVAANYRIPVITRGSATGLAGGVIPEQGGIILTLARMNRLLEIDTANAVAIVEPGLVNQVLQQAVEEQGLFYPPDPASLRQCTIGGNVATNAGGPRCLKYGSTRDYVIGLEVVTASGSVLELGGRFAKNSTGYQLMQLFCGSEGTLGIVTRITLRLLPLPRARSTAAAFFPTLDQAATAVAAITQAGVLPSSLELLDGLVLDVVDRAAGLGLPWQGSDAMLILEQDGPDAAVAGADVTRMAQVCRDHGATAVVQAVTEEERSRVWGARRAAGGATGLLGPNKLSEDIVVPRARVPDLIRRIRAISAETGLPIPTWGHAGDGNLHPAIIFDRRRPGELERVEAAAAAILRAALELGGSLSGEHGLGTLKRPFLAEAVGPDVLATMRTIKAALDPLGILNPGKVLPPDDGPAPSGFLAALPTLEGIDPG